jgi:hypothetical protein
MTFDFEAKLSAIAGITRRGITVAQCPLIEKIVD